VACRHLLLVQIRGEADAAALGWRRVHELVDGLENAGDRLVVGGERALSWIERYQLEVRPELVVGRNQQALFLTNLGEPFTPPRLTELVRDYVLAAKLGRPAPVTCSATRWRP
jgi:site-specific recombinase XerD